MSKTLGYPFQHTAIAQIRNRVRISKYDKMADLKKAACESTSPTSGKSKRDIALSVGRKVRFVK